jgi:hypothetical protein
MPLERVRKIVLYDGEGVPVTAAVTADTVYDVVRRLPNLPQVIRVVLESATHRVDIIFGDDYDATVKVGGDDGVWSALDRAKVYNVEYNGALSASPVRDGLAPVIRNWSTDSYPFPSHLTLELASGIEVGLTIIGLDGVNYMLVDF